MFRQGNGLFLHLRKRLQSLLGTGAEKSGLFLPDIIRNEFDFRRFFPEEETVPDASLKIIAVVVQMSSVDFLSFIQYSFPTTSPARLGRSGKTYVLRSSGVGAVYFTGVFARNA